MTTVTIAVVGDVLMWREQIAAARRANGEGYDFDGVFRDVKPLLRRADLVIGNLETTLSGREAVYQRKNPKNGYPMFNCPDELAGALKRAGFHVLTTANNHCLDRGERGLRRTLDVLDAHGLRHTGTARTQAEAGRLLVLPVKGIRVGLLAYTYGTNGNLVPEGKEWMVNRLWRKKVAADISRLRRRADMVLVAAHFGTEFKHHPNERQRAWVDFMFQSGADAVLGCHPHVLQPMQFRRVPSAPGCSRKFVIYSLGNFVSVKMWNNPDTLCGVVLTLALQRKADGTVVISNAHAEPTWVQRRQVSGRTTFRVLPIRRTLAGRALPPSDKAAMRTALGAARRSLGIAGS